MKRTLALLLGLALMGLGSAALAQTTPAPHPKTQPVKAAPRTKGSAAPKRPAPAPSFIKDTAAFRRSGRPADRLPTRPRPKQ